MCLLTSFIWVQGIDFAYAKDPTTCEHCKRNIAQGSLYASYWFDPNLEVECETDYSYHVLCSPFPSDEYIAARNYPKPWKDSGDVNPASDLSDADRVYLRAILDYVMNPANRNQAKQTKRTRVDNSKFGRTVLDFGKHKGETFSGVRRKDPGYCEWALGLGERKCKGQMKQFRKYLRSE